MSLEGVRSREYFSTHEESAFRAGGWLSLPPGGEERQERISETTSVIFGKPVAEASTLKERKITRRAFSPFGEEGGESMKEVVEIFYGPDRESILEKLNGRVSPHLCEQGRRAEGSRSSSPFEAFLAGRGEIQKVMGEGKRETGRLTPTDAARILHSRHGGAEEASSEEKPGRVYRDEEGNIYVFTQGDRDSGSYKALSSSVRIALEKELYEHERVALVTIKADPQRRKTRAEQEEALHAEYTLMKSLPHPHIAEAPFTELRLPDGSLGFVIKFYEGGSAQNVCSRREEYTLEQVYEYVAGIARALSYMHEKGIVHRDVKPANILLTEEGGTIAVLNDFGTAGTVEEKLGFQKGTLAFMAPEHALRNEFPQAGPDDMWALGLSALWMLLGKEHPLLRYISQKQHQGHDIRENTVLFFKAIDDVLAEVHDYIDDRLSFAELPFSTVTEKESRLLRLIQGCLRKGRFLRMTGEEAVNLLDERRAELPRSCLQGEEYVRSEAGGADEAFDATLSPRLSGIEDLSMQDTPPPPLSDSYFSSME